MNIFSKRPLLSALFSFVFFSILVTVISKNATYCLMLSLVFAFFLHLSIAVILLFTKSKYFKFFSTVSLCLFFSSVAVLSAYNFFFVKVESAEKYKDEKNVVATIKECTFTSSYACTYIAKIKSIDGMDVNFSAEITSTPPVNLEIGETIMADMSFAPFTTTDYGFDARKSRMSNGILVSASFAEAKIIEANSDLNTIILFNKLRDKVDRIIDKNFDKSAAIIKALLIGKTDDVDAKTRDNFKSLGISHILSISGTHFTVLLGMIAVLLSLFGLNKKAIYALLIPFALFYIGLSGFTFSVCRAGIMALLSYWSFLCGRQRDSYTALFISLALILLIAPYSVLSISLWLSFTATFTILVIVDLFSPYLSIKKKRWYRKFFDYLFIHILITVSVVFATLPIVSIYFGYVSKIAPISNVLIVPLFEIFLYIIPFAVIFSRFGFLCFVTDEYGSWLLKMIEKISSINGLTLAVNQRFVTVIAIISISLTLILIALPLKKKFLIALPSVFGIIAILIGLVLFYENRKEETFVSYYTTGVSDALMITDFNRTACIDITAGTTASMYYTQAMIKEHYSTELHSYFFTHYRKAHINAFEKLASRTKIKQAFFPPASDEKSEEYRNELVYLAKSHNIEVIDFEYGDAIKFENCEITVLQPVVLKRSSHEVISVYVSTEKDDLLYLGSSFSECEFDFSEYVSDAEYIIFGQHYPKIKSRFSLDTTASLIYGDSDIFTMSDIASKGIVMENGDKYHFLLK